MQSTSMSYVQGRIVSFAIMAALALSVILPVMNNRTADANEKGRASSSTSYATPYMAHPVAGAHTISITLTGNDQGTLLLDPNVCQVDAFGDPTTSTRMASQQIGVHLAVHERKDPTGQSRAVYDLVRTAQKKTILWPKFTLVVYRGAAAPARLIVKQDEQTTFVLVMQRVVPAKGSPVAAGPVPVEPKLPVVPTKPVVVTPPGTNQPLQVAKTITYTAEQVGHFVKLTARGNHPSAGWQSQFEDTPVAKFPPDFRLVSIAPKGMVAQVISPFEVTRSFPSSSKLGTLTVHDGAGTHSVKVVHRK